LDCRVILFSWRTSARSERKRKVLACPFSRSQNASRSREIYGVLISTTSCGLHRAAQHQRRNSTFGSRIGSFPPASDGSSARLSARVSFRFQLSGGRARKPDSSILFSRLVREAAAESREILKNVFSDGDHNVMRRRRAAAMLYSARPFAASRSFRERSTRLRRLRTRTSGSTGGKAE
jgi:hypothetical protein